MFLPTDQTQLLLPGMPNTPYKLFFDMFQENIIYCSMGIKEFNRIFLTMSELELYNLNYYYFSSQ